MHVSQPERYRTASIATNRYDDYGDKHVTSTSCTVPTCDVKHGVSDTQTWGEGVIFKCVGHVLSMGFKS